jgi:plasmid stability protein
MCRACFHVIHMATMLQIRNVPDALHRKLKARAALAGMSMSEYALRELSKALERPTRAELLARLAELPSPNLDPSPAEVIREERDGR